MTSSAPSVRFLATVLIVEFTSSLRSSTGSATMSGGSNTYAGPTQLVSGILFLSGGDNRLPTTTTVAFNPENAANAAATLDLGSTNQTISALTFPTGAANVGRAMTLTIMGTGTLTVNGPSDLTVGAGGVASMTSTNGNHHQLDMSGLNSFVFDNPAQSVVAGLTAGSPASASATSNVATVNFAVNNSITALDIHFAGGAGASGGGQTTVQLGQTNVWNVTSLNAAWSSRSDVDVSFNAAFFNPTLTLRALDGTGAVDFLRIGRVNDTTTRTWTDTVDLSAGSVDALVTTMVIGSADPSSATRGGTVNASFTMGAGSLSVSDLTIGAFRASADGNGTNSTMRGNGTFTLNNAAGTLNATTIRLADVPTVVAETGTKSTTGTLALVDGLVKATTITRGSQVGVLSGGVAATARVEFTGGTIQNTDGADLAIDDVEMQLLADTGTRTIFVSGTNTAAMNAGTVVSGIGSLTKAGTGTLTMAADNTYTGMTTIVGGTLELTATGQIASSVSITNDAAFLVTGGTHSLTSIAGVGNTVLADSAQVTVNSVVQGELAVGPGSKLTLNALGGGLAGGSPQPVPEPTAWLLLAIGALGLAARRWRRQS